MKVTVAAVGKIRDRSLRTVEDDYLSRVRHYLRCEELETRDAEGLTRVALPEAVRVALEVNGQALTSKEFAQKLERWFSVGKGNVVFFIGAAAGIPEVITQSADFKFSLSTLTLPHRLARVLLFEQLYRAMTILRREPYAREE